MSSSKSEGQQQVQDLLVALEAEMDEWKGKIKKLEAKIEAFENKTSEEEWSKNAAYLKWNDQLIEDIKRLNGLEDDRRGLRAQHFSATTSTAQQGK